MAAKPAFGTPSTGLTFGTPTTSSFGFGGTYATTSAGGGFGSNSFNFGTTTSAPTPNLSFGATATTSASPLAFGTSAASTAPPLGTFNFSANTTTTTSAPSLGFSFGGATANTSTAPPAFGLGSGSPGLFGKPLTTLTTDASKPPTTVSVGLGGVDSNVHPLTGAGGPGISTGGTGTGQAAPAPKSVALPNELATAVDSFKSNIRQCKQLSSDIARCSIRPLNKVQSEADSLLRETTELTADLAARRRTVNNLRGRAAIALPASERAHRISETPHGLEYESGDAIAWITEVVAEGESRLRLLRRQLEAAQRQLDASPKPVTDEELSLGMRRIHESFVAVAGRLQAVHQQVEAQKTQYLALRRNILKDPTDIFAKVDKSTSNKTLNSEWLSKTTTDKSVPQPTSAVVADLLTALGMSQSSRQNSTTGPSPFSNLGLSGFNGIPFGFSKNQSPPSCSSLASTTWNSTFQSGQMFSGIGNQSSFGAGLTNPNQSQFALQKPPAGNKRGKH